MIPEDLAKSGSEHGNQSAFFMWCQINTALYPELQWIFAIPNGGVRDKITGGKLKAAGVKAGISDIMFSVARYPYHGLFIEMKHKKYENAKNGGLSDEQIEFSSFIIEQGYKFAVCYTWIEARDVILKYLRRR